MSELEFAVLDVTPEPYAATPNLVFRLRIRERTGVAVHAIALRCQIRISPHRRAYTDEEAAGLDDLFGARERWRDTLKPFLWTHATAMVRGFTDSITVEVPVPCTYDFEVTASKYLHALRGGDVPLVLLFSGTVFTRGPRAAGETGGFGVEQLAWHCEASYRMPVAVWRALMDSYFPGGGWIRLDRDTLDALIRYKSARALPSWEQAFGELLAAAAEPVS